MDVAMTATWVIAMLTSSTVHAPVMLKPWSGSRSWSGSSTWSGRRAARGSRRARLARLPADSANGFGLAVHIGEQIRILRSLEPLLDQGPHDDLQAEAQPHRRRGTPRERTGTIEEIAGQNNQDTRLTIAHSL